MERNGTINILLVEDEEFDVKRVKKTISYYDTRLKVLDVVSNGRAALELIKDNPDRYDVVNSGLPDIRWTKRGRANYPDKKS